MYDIGHIIIGTHLPWGSALSFNDFIPIEDEPGCSEPKSSAIARQYILHDYKHDRKAFEGTLGEDETPEEALENLLGEPSGYPWLDQHGDLWTSEYHGAADDPVAWVGVELATFDVTNHFPFSDLMEVANLISADIISEAEGRYSKIPEGVRKLLPPFGVYVVWGTS